MINITKIIAIICARGGSKSVPRKNIKKLLGIPLLAYTIKTAIKCKINILSRFKLIDRVIVSTDDKEIADMAKRYGAEVPFIRPKRLARDTTATAPVVKHVINYLEHKENYIPDIIILLDVTSPLRTKNDIKNCVLEIIKKKADAAVTVCVPHANPYFNMVEYKRNGFVGLVKPLKERPKRRQDAPKVYWVNSSVWVIKKEVFMKTGSFFPEKTVIVEMPESRSFHIDSEFDFKLLELIMKTGVVKDG